MPVSWEVASGPSTAYRMAGQGSACVAVEGPKTSNILSFRVQDAMSICFCTNGEALKGASNGRLASAQDIVVRGFATLSLHGSHYQQADASVNPEDCGSGLNGAFCYEAPEAYRCMSSSNYDSLPVTFESSAVSNGKMHLCDSDFVPGSGEYSKMTAFNPVSKFDCSPCIDRRPVQSSSSILTETCAESMPMINGFDLDTISESSSLSNNGMLALSSSSEEVSQALDDSEVQSPYKEGDNSHAEELPNLPRKGLSRFYAAKSRSFSCLRDAVSIKDLAKPESPYLKKRRINSNNSRLPPLQKGSAAISKRPSQSGKSTLALAVAMSAKQENGSQSRHSMSKSLVPSRSYSLSDLQSAAMKEGLFFIG